MRKLLNEECMKNIIYGATFFGAGGGGSLSDGLNLLSKLEKIEKAQVELFDIDEMGRDYAASVAAIGSPIAIKESDFGREAVEAFKTLQRVEFFSGKRVNYLIAGELGGFNTMVAMYVSALAGVPLVNGDMVGRAVPELSTTLSSIYNVPSSPLVLAGGKTDVDVIVAYPADIYKTKTTEKIARSVCMAYDMLAAFSTWTVNAEDITNKLVSNSINNCSVVGEAILNAEKNNLNVIDEIKKVIESKVIITGEVTNVELKQKGGFDIGITHIKGIDKQEDKNYKIYFKNENIIVKDENDKAIGTVPDLICMVDVENCTPLTNADIKEGMKVSYIGVSAPENWIKDPKGFDVWRDILDKCEYNGEFIRV